jgi:hypothetical protein
METTAASFKVAFRRVDVRDPVDLARIFEVRAENRVDALVVGQDSLLTRDKVIE